MTENGIAIGNADSSAFRDAFERAGSLRPTGVAVVAGLDLQERPFGLTVSSLTVVSYAPALISVSLDASSRRVEQLRSAKKFSANLLAKNQAALATRFGTPGIVRFEGVSWQPSSFGPPILEGVHGALLCEFKNTLEVGDHQLILAEVKRFELAGGEPLIYWRRAFHALRLEYPFTESNSALEEFFERWTLGTLPKSQWTHGAHVGMAAYFAFDHGPEAAFEKIKAGIVHFNTCVGTPNSDDQGYHETLTRFWSETVGGFVRNGKFASRLEAVRRAVAVFGEDRDRHRLFYSFDVVRNRAARKTWVAPDRNPSQPACGRQGRAGVLR